MRRSFLAALMVLPASITLANAEELRWYDHAPATYINYGPPESDALMSISCEANQSLVASVPAPAGLTGDAAAVVIEGLGGRDKALALVDRNSDGMMTMPVNPGSILVTSLLTEQPITIRSGEMAEQVSGQGASRMLTRLLIACLGGSAPAPVATQPMMNTPAAQIPFRPRVNVALPTMKMPPPSFRQFPAALMYRGPSHEAVLDTQDKYSYRTRLRNAARDSINFGGRYTLAIWGCGTSCATGGVVDHITGKVVFLPGPVTGAVSMDDNFDSVVFQADSRLLILSGQINDEGPFGMHFYDFNGERFVKVHFVPTDKEITGWSQVIAQVK
jgi:hypothetical protein